MCARLCVCVCPFVFRACDLLCIHPSHVGDTVFVHDVQIGAHCGPGEAWAADVRLYYHYTSPGTTCASGSLYEDGHGDIYWQHTRTQFQSSRGWVVPSQPFAKTRTTARQKCTYNNDSRRLTLVSVRVSGSPLLAHSAATSKHHNARVRPNERLHPQPQSVQALA